MPIVILLVWLLFDLIVWVIQGLAWLAGAIIQLFIAFPFTLLAFLGGALLWGLASYAGWILFVALICGALALAVIIGLKWLNRSKRRGRAESRRIDPAANREVSKVRDRNFSGCGEVYMTEAEMTFGCTKSVYIEGHLFEVRVPGGRSPGSILQLSGKRLRSEPGCTGKPFNSEVLSIRILAIEEA
jgi:hypothetical protein